MKKNIGLKEMQEIEKHLLKEIREVCEKLHLKYYLCGGTLLGAVRHKGFIPWDDDIDIYMMREDYEKLENYFISINGLYKNSRLLSMKLEDDYYYPMMKLVDTKTYMKELDTVDIKNMGVYIDIFPLDGSPNNRVWRKIYMKRINLLKKTAYMAYYNKFETNTRLLKPIKYVWFKMSKLFGPIRIAKHMEKIVQKYSPYHSEYIGNVVSGEVNALTPASLYKEEQLYDFEGEKYTGVKNYDTYLTTMYGDYMKLPPKEKRVTHHHYIAYYK